MAVAQVTRQARRTAGEQICQFHPSSVLQIGEERLVDKVGVIAIHAILDLELPVCSIAILVNTCSHIEFSFRGEIDEQVQLLFDRLTEMLIQRDATGPDCQRRSRDIWPCVALYAPKSSLRNQRHSDPDSDAGGRRCYGMSSHDRHRNG